MAGQDVVSTYLRSKLSSILQEADADPSSPSQIISRFRSIECRINFICESSRSSPPPSVVDLLYDLINVLSDCRVYAHRRRKSAASTKGFFRFFSKKKIGERLDAIEKNIPEKISEAGVHIYSPPTVAINQQTFPVLFNLEAKADEIAALLVSNLPTKEEDAAAYGITAIGIVGMCGCGKTALAQKVFASSEIQDEFFPRIWVCLSGMLSEGVDKRVTVLKYILEQLGHDISSDLDYSGSNVIELLEKLHLKLVGKRYLIVLDDAWRFDEFYADLPRGNSATTAEFLSHGLPKWSGGGIILTSRSENVIKRTVGGEHVIRMEDQLSHEICRKIFDSVVREQGKIDVDHPELVKIKDDLIKICDGLPLAVTSLATIISERKDYRKKSHDTFIGEVESSSKPSIEAHNALPRAHDELECIDSHLDLTHQSIEPNLSSGDKDIVPCPDDLPELHKLSPIKDLPVDLQEFQKLSPIKDLPADLQEFHKLSPIKELPVTRPQINKNVYNQLPQSVVKYFSQINDVKRDGNCGFRVVASMLGIGEENWLTIRDELITELRDNNKIYMKIFKSEKNILRLIKSLEYSSSPDAPKDNWMEFPDIGHVIASCYYIVLHFFSPKLCLTFLPLYVKPNSIMRKEFGMAFVNDNHFVHIVLKKDCPVPPIANRWTEYTYQEQTGNYWDIAYKSRTMNFRDLVNPSVVALLESPLDDSG